MLQTLLFLGVGVIAVLAFGVMTILSLRRIVPTNEVHVVRTAGKTTCYGGPSKEGENKNNTYYEFPKWVPVWGCSVTQLSTSVFDVDLKSYEAYDKDRLPFVVDIKSFFRITAFDVAAVRVDTFDELKEQLLGIVQGAVRSLLANEDLEKIMSERSKYGEEFTNSVKPQLKEWGVEPVKNIELMDIRDSQGSSVIANIKAKKESQVEMESRRTVAENMQKAKEAEILAMQEVSLKEQKANQEIGLRTAEVEREVGIAQEKAKQEIQAQAKVTTEKEMAVKQVNEVRTAEIARDAALVKANEEKQVAEINAEAGVVTADGAKKVSILNAEADKQRAELKAAADLTIATNSAKGIELQGAAKASAEKAMQCAPVEAQIKLAKEIGDNKEYQKYLVTIEQIKAATEVGKEQAKNLGGAKIEIIANAGNVADGVNQAQGIFSSKSGLNIASFLETLGSTKTGKNLINAVTSRIQGEDQPIND